MQMIQIVQTVENSHSYIVEAYKFGKGKKEFDFVLSGSIDDIISLDNQRPSVTVEQYDGDSFAINAVITGTAWDGQSGPYPLDVIAYDRQFGLIEALKFNHQAVLIGTMLSIRPVQTVN